MRHKKGCFHQRVSLLKGLINKEGGAWHLHVSQCSQYTPTRQPRLPRPQPCPLLLSTTHFCVRCIIIITSSRTSLIKSSSTPQLPYHHILHNSITQRNANSKQTIESFRGCWWRTQWFVVCVPLYSTTPTPLPPPYLHYSLQTLFLHHDPTPVLSHPAPSSGINLLPISSRLLTLLHPLQSTDYTRPKPRHVCL